MPTHRLRPPLLLGCVISLVAASLAATATDFSFWNSTSAGPLTMREQNAQSKNDAANPYLPRRKQLLQLFRREFVKITPGKGSFPKSFVMGSKAAADQGPTRTVTMKANFEIASNEVTQELWHAVMGENPSRWTGDRNSVELLSFDEAEAFCRQVTTLMRGAGLIGDQQQVVLPSEAEWEYVARAGTTTTWSFGDDQQSLTDYAWYTGNASGNDPPVAAKHPNPWGLFDMHGYLWEWCSDTYQPNYQGAPQDQAAWIVPASKQRVLRGGSWKDPASKTTSAHRRGAEPQLRDDAVGLRCVIR